MDSKPDYLDPASCRVVPMIATSRLDGMVDVALSHPQLRGGPEQKSRFAPRPFGLLSGGVALAACLVLFIGIGLTRQEVAPPPLPLAVETAPADDPGQEVSELIFADMVDNY